MRPKKNDVAIEHRLLNELCRWADKDETWRDLTSHITNPACGVHLAILVEPYLTYLLQGRKTMESRFSQNRIAPYKRVNPSDLVVVKKTAGPVVASFIVTSVEFVVLTPQELLRLKTNYSSAICGNEAFWAERREKNFATLIGVGEVQEHAPREIVKPDRRGWLVLRQSLNKHG